MTDALLELEENRLFGLTVAWPGQFISTLFLRTEGKQAHWVNGSLAWTVYLYFVS